MYEPTKTDAKAFEDALNSTNSAAELADDLMKVVTKYAERTTLSMTEAASLIGSILQSVSTVVDFVVQTAEQICDALSRLWEDLQEVADPFAPPASKLRRQWEKDRARQIESLYRAKIRRLERFKPYRRVYRPP